jgi:hypothetical protein
MLRAAHLLLAIFFAADLFAASPASYHLELQSSPASVVPLLAKFGTIELHVYGGGVRAESMWLDGFSRNGSKSITLVNPVARMYTDVPVTGFPAFVARMTGMSIDRSASADVPKLAAPTTGKVNGVDARRYRLAYSPTEWIDVWTTSVVPENMQLRRIVDEFIANFAPGTAAPMRRIPGNPVYVELNTEEHPRFPLLQLKSLRFGSDGEAEALRVGSFFFKAPLLDAIWK